MDALDACLRVYRRQTCGYGSNTTTNQTQPIHHAAPVDVDKDDSPL